jgi:hypothetical protein
LTDNIYESIAKLRNDLGVYVDDMLIKDSPNPRDKKIPLPFHKWIID